jgi:hypothetical protein
MSTYEIVSIVAMVGWLILMGSALASFRLGWGKTMQMALVWLAIFAGGTLLVGLFVG